MLLDIHPEPEHPRVQVHSAGQVHDLGQVDFSPYIRDIRAGRGIIEQLVQDGLFVREGQAVFENIGHAGDVDSWLTHRAESASRSILAPEIVDRAQALLASGDGELLVLNHGYASSLRRV